MSRVKKKLDREDDGINREPQKEHFEIDFDRIFLISRTRLGVTQYEAEIMTFGKWADIFHAFKELYNLETKQMLYADVERETEQYKATHQPVVSLLNI